jgi:hypothetical protein
MWLQVNAYTCTMTYEENPKIADVYVSKYHTIKSSIQPTQMASKIGRHTAITM